MILAMYPRCTNFSAGSSSGTTAPYRLQQLFTAMQENYLCSTYSGRPPQIRIISSQVQSASATFPTCTASLVFVESNLLKLENVLYLKPAGWRVKTSLSARKAMSSITGPVTSDSVTDCSSLLRRFFRTVMARETVEMDPITHYKIRCNAVSIMNII